MKQYASCLSMNWRVIFIGWTLLAVFLQTTQITEATSSFPNPTPEGNSWAPCAFAAEQLAAEGNGSTYGSCLACDPTSFECPSRCQPLINALYKKCNGVYAPQDQYFDPAHTLNGYWNDNFGVLRVQAARCGCNNSLTVWSQQWLVWAMTFTTVAAGFMFT